jgi:hypothetical protein
MPICLCLFVLCFLLFRLVACRDHVEFTRHSASRSCKLVCLACEGKTLTSFITRALAHQPAPIGQTFLVYSSRSRALHVLPREQTLQGTRHQTSNRGMNQQANKNAGRKAHRDTNYTIEWNAILRVAALHTSGAKGSPPDFT